MTRMPGTRGTPETFRRLLLAGALAVAFSGLTATAASAAGDARLQGTFAMRGTLTFVDHVYGEYRGQHVRRLWTFVPHCTSGTCRRITLERQRSGRHLLDVVVLKRRGAGLYSGRGRFWVALKCAGQLVRRGGLATETITVRIVRSAVVGTTRFATALRARYTNPFRENLTRCPGGIGRDAARYRGPLASSRPGPPAASFTDTPDVATTSAAFADHSKPGRGGAPIVAWAWNFGDPASSSDTSSSRDPTHQYSAHGSYTVTLEVRDAYGQIATRTAQVTV
jgi:hypothetical protein